MSNTAEIINFPVEKQKEGQEIVKADTKEGFTQLANTLLDYLCMIDITKRQWRVMISLIRKTYGYNKKTDWIVAGQIKDQMKYPGAITHIHSDIRELKERAFIIEDGHKIGPNSLVSEWILVSKKQKTIINEANRKRSSSKPKTVTEQTEISLNSDEDQSPQKINTITKNNIKETYNICPDEIHALFNEKLHELKKVLKLNLNRKTLIQDRIKDLPTRKDWELFFDKIKYSNFLMGRVTGFEATFDWILKDSNFLKIIEGNYDNKVSYSTSQDINAWDQALNDTSWAENLEITGNEL